MFSGKESMRLIASLLKEKGMRDSEFARAIGVGSSYIANWKVRGIPSERLPQAADVLNVSLDYLTGRVAAPIPSDAPRVELSGCIPVIGSAKLGDDGFYAVENTNFSAESGALELPRKDPKAYAIRCYGNSMTPRIQNGEFVIAEPSRAPEPGDEVVVYDTSGRVMVKRFLYWREGCLYLQSINSNSENIVLNKDEVRDMNPVLAIVPKRFLKEFVD